MTAQATQTCTHYLMRVRCPVALHVKIERLGADGGMLTFSAMSRLSPSTYAKLRFTQPGYPLASPLRTTCSTCALILVMRRSDRCLIHL